MPNEIVTGDSAGYEFRGIPLTPAIAQTLIRELFAGKMAGRKEIVERVLREHLGRGGQKPTAQDATQPVKKALGDMQESGAAVNAATGFWRIGQPPSNDRPDEMVSETVVDVGVAADESVIALEESADIDTSADAVLGAGPGAIYVYYLPTYRNQAEEHGDRVWPCKVGRTDRDPLSRVLSQAATALPERPRIGLIIRTSVPLAWESAIHGVLTVRGRRIENVPGVEWFRTSPEQVSQLAVLIDPTLSGPDNNGATQVMGDGDQAS